MKERTGRRRSPQSWMRLDNHEEGKQEEEEEEEERHSDVGRVVDEIIDEVSETVGDMAGSEKRQLLVEREWDVEAEATARLRVETNNGEIEVVGTDEAKVEVKAIIKVRAPSEEEAGAFFDEVEFRAERAGDEIIIKADHAKPPRGVRLTVNYYVRSPRHLAVDAQALNGGISLHGMEGGAEAVTTSGAVEIRGGRGRLRAGTKNGKVTADVDMLEESGEFSSANGKVEVKISAGQAPLEAKTLNGSVEVTLPGDFDGQLNAQTSNGRVRSDFPVIQAEPGRKNRLAGPLGKGGETEVKLKTLNGNIELRKGID